MKRYACNTWVVIGTAIRIFIGIPMLGISKVTAAITDVFTHPVTRIPGANDWRKKVSK